MNKDEIVLSRGAIDQVRQMVVDVPQPTVAELQKLLAIQGSILNSLGIALISKSKKFAKFGDKKAFVRLALDCLRESRFALDSAVNAESKKPSISED